jgi:hypothetical protein
MLRKFSAAVLAAFVVVVPITEASPRKPATLCTKAWPVRQAVVKQHGKRAPGLNICRHGVRHSDGTYTKATTAQKARYIRAMRRLIAPAPYLSLRAVPPGQPPAGTLSARASPRGLAACIVAAESGGNPQASNGTHFGIGQWDMETWRAHGGTRFASSPLGATYDQQLQVLNDALVKYGCRSWCPYDPC